MRPEWVTIHNPDLPDAPPSVVTRDAFDDVWSRKGFVIVEPPKPKPKKAKPKKEAG